MPLLVPQKIKSEQSIIRESFGKPVDILALKKNVQSDFNNLSARHHQEISDIFKNRKINLNVCPICQTKNEDKPTIIVHGGIYLHCPHCNHFYVGNGLNNQETINFYQKSTKYSATYTDKETAKLRIKQVSLPKAKWALHEYYREYGRYPKKILDIGAGGGHMVAAFRELGFCCGGVEISQDSQLFAKEVLGIKLISSDFLTLKLSDFGSNPPDLITFWGVLEHVNDPIRFLLKSHEILDPTGGSVIAAVPNYQSGSTLIQKIFPDSILRNLGPESHLHMFSSESISLSFEKTGFTPFAKWYIGMDAYEFWTQLVTASRLEYLKSNKLIFLLQIKIYLSELKLPSVVLEPIENFVNFLTTSNHPENKSEISILIEKLQTVFDQNRCTDEIIVMSKTR